MIPDYQHEANLRERDHLTNKYGFALEVTADGYFVWFKGSGLGGASVQLPRKKPLHHTHRKANIRDNLDAAVRFAKNSVPYRRIKAVRFANEIRLEAHRLCVSARSHEEYADLEEKHGCPELAAAGRKYARACCAAAVAAGHTAAAVLKANPPHEAQ